MTKLVNAQPLLLSHLCLFCHAANSFLLKFQTVFIGNRHVITSLPLFYTLYLHTLRLFLKKPATTKLSATQSPATLVLS